jgi:hypothetical protein
VSRLILVLVVCAGGMAVALIASAAGWLGGVSVCGADYVPGCVAWPLLVSDGLWAAFIVGAAALLVWQVRT